jgi:predicted amidophosphoribosyltransferase
MNWRGAANAILVSLFEPPCAACSRILPQPLDGAVCETCWAQVRQLPSSSAQNGLEGHALDAIVAIGEYEGRLRDIIHAFKYDGRRSIAPLLGGLMRAAGSHLLHDADVAVPVPLHRRRERARGFNQAEDLARMLGLPVKRLVRRVIATAPQVELPATERHRNVRDAFALSFPTRELRSARSWFLPTSERLPARSSIPAVIVLVDDVSTTGATLEACARVLKDAGAREVRGITAARVVSARR